MLDVSILDVHDFFRPKFVTLWIHRVGCDSDKSLLSLVSNLGSITLVAPCMLLQTDSEYRVSVWLGQNVTREFKLLVALLFMSGMQVHGLSPYYILGLSYVKMMTQCV